MAALLCSRSDTRLSVKMQPMDAATVEDLKPSKIQIWTYDLHEQL